MRINRRWFTKSLPLWAFGGAALNMVGHEAHAGWFMNDKVTVSIKVQDEAGRAIPFVTVWQFAQIDPAHVSDDRHLELTIEDLWRATLRYKETSEFVLSYGLRPVPQLRMPPMGNQQGEMRDVVDNEEMTGKGNHYPRPDPLVFGYTFMKRGYLPNKLAFTVSKQDSKVEAVVTLQRAPNESIDSSAYLQTYDRIRYELSDTQKNTAMTPENGARMEGLRKELEQAAQQAIAAKDNKAAARMYARMRYLPELRMIDGRIAGFSQTDVVSERSKQALQRAYELDPDNLFVWMQTIDKRANYPLRASQAERIQRNVAQLESLIAKFGEAAWPWMYEWRAGSYANLGDFSKARALYLEAAKLEPKFTDWQKLIEDLKRAMGKKGVTVPGDW
jgi:hypothetical protein